MTVGLFLVVPADFAHEVVESLVDVDALLGRCLDEWATEPFCDIVAL